MKGIAVCATSLVSIHFVFQRRRGWLSVHSLRLLSEAEMQPACVHWRRPCAALSGTALLLLVKEPRYLCGMKCVVSRPVLPASSATFTFTPWSKAVATSSASPYRAPSISSSAPSSMGSGSGLDSTVFLNDSCSNAMPLPHAQLVARYPDGPGESVSRMGQHRRSPLSQAARLLDRF
jgi:hypothetical protein